MAQDAPAAWLNTCEDGDGVLTHELIDMWAELCAGSRRRSLFERIRFAFLKRKYGSGVVLRRWHAPSMRVKIRVEYYALQIRR